MSGGPDSGPDQNGERLLRELREAQAVARMGSWTTNLATMAVTWSEQTHRIFETDPAQFRPTHAAFLELVHPDDRATVDAAFLASLDCQDPQQIDHRIVVDGRVKVVRERWQVVHDADGRPVRAIGTCQDITEQAALESERLRNQRIQSIGTLAGGLAHDLNNILAPILLSVSVLERDERDPDRRDMLNTIEVSARRGADLVRKVLNFARGQESARNAVDVGAIVDEVVHVVRETFPRNIQLEVQIAPDLPAALGDGTQIHQVLMNLVLNARDALAAGGQLRIRLDRGMHHGREGVLMDVEDTGVGIPPENLEQMFDPFFTTKDPGYGTGLGLPTVQAIVAAHEGHIEVTSKPGHGTTFRVWWPMAPGTSAGGVHEAPVTVLPGSGQRILVIDDEEHIRKLAQRALERHGYQVRMAVHGQQALEIYAATPDAFALVLTDLSMPVMDGLATIRAMRAINPGVRVLTMSGLPGTSQPPPADLSPFHFLPKPYTIDELLVAVQQALAGPA